MDFTSQFFSFGPIVGFCGFIFVLLTYFWIVKQPSGNEKMTLAILKKKYSIFLIFLFIVAIAFLGSMTAASVGLIGLALVFKYYTDGITVDSVNSFAIGAPSIALFGRVGGGIEGEKKNGKANAPADTGSTAGLPFERLLKPCNDYINKTNVYCGASYCASINQIRI